MDEMTTAALLADADAVREASADEERRMRGDHHIFMVYVLPALMIAMGMASDGWHWWFAGVMALYVVAMRWMLKRAFSSTRRPAHGG